MVTFVCDLGGDMVRMSQQSGHWPLGTGVCWGPARLQYRQVIGGTLAPQCVLLVAQGHLETSTVVARGHVCCARLLLLHCGDEKWAKFLWKVQ